MTGLIERIGSLAGTEAAKAVNLAHGTFQDRMAVHRHTGRALVETAIAVCRAHPNMVGIGVALLVEQLLVEERRLHEAHAKADAAAAAPGGPEPANEPANDRVSPKARERHGLVAPHLHTPDLRAANLHLSQAKLHRIRPGRIALEVFGALLLLKLGAVGARMLRRKHQPDVWFAPAAQVRLFSATIAAYNLAAAIRSPDVSAWRNGAIALFGTDAIKPLLKARPTRLVAMAAPSAPPAGGLVLQTADADHEQPPAIDVAPAPPPFAPPPSVAPPSAAPLSVAAAPQLADAAMAPAS